MVINQYVYWSLLLCNIGPHLFCSLHISKVCLVKVNMFEVNISSKDLHILNKLCLEIAADIYDNKVYTTGQMSPYELLR